MPATSAAVKNTPTDDPRHFRLTRATMVGYLITERAAIVVVLRKVFDAYGFDVQRYSDDAVSKALLAESRKALSPEKRISLAFKRLVNAAA